MKRAFTMIAAAVLLSAVSARGSDEGAHEALVAQFPTATSPHLPDLDEKSGANHQAGEPGEHGKMEHEKAGKHAPSEGGDKGEAGEHGKAGEKGHVGEHGEAGEHGEKVPAGEHGQLGDHGKVGDLGEHGEIGEQATGSKGPGDRGEVEEHGGSGQSGGGHGHEDDGPHL
jgi:hypothetical protein